MQARSLVRPLFAILCLGATALGLNNTYGDDSEVEALAQSTACGAAPCVDKVLSKQRSAFKQTFGFQTALLQKGQSPRHATVDVECRRAYVLLGEYSCSVLSDGEPQVH